MCHWHVYLASRNFVLKADHNPLIFLRSQKDPRGKLRQWINELEEFNYTIKYVPAKKMQRLMLFRATMRLTQTNQHLPLKVRSMPLLSKAKASWSNLQQSNFVTQLLGVLS